MKQAKEITTMHTAFEAAMIAAGGPGSAEATFAVAVALFQSNGGSQERALEIVRDAYANAGDAGQKNPARLGHHPGAASPATPHFAHGGAVGQRACAEKADVAQPAAPPPRQPLSRAAVLAARNASATAILKIDGDDIMDFTIGRAITAARVKGKERYVLSTLGGMYGHLDHGKTFREVSSPSIVSSVVAQAEAHADA